MPRPIKYLTDEERKQAQREAEKKWREAHRWAVNEKARRSYWKRVHGVTDYTGKSQIVDFSGKPRVPNAVLTPEQIAERVTERETRQRAHKRVVWHRFRASVLEAYGGKCVRCGFADSRALQLDHINGGGHKDYITINTRGVLRRAMDEVGNGTFQLLCANCNWIKRYEDGDLASKE